MGLEGGGECWSWLQVAVGDDCSSGMVLIVGGVGDSVKGCRRSVNDHYKREIDDIRRILVKIAEGS